MFEQEEAFSKVLHKENNRRPYRPPTPHPKAKGATQAAASKLTTTPVPVKGSLEVLEAAKIGPSKNLAPIRTKVCGGKNCGTIECIS